MHEINHLPPERMTPEQRRHEVAFLLANGLVRLREAAYCTSRKRPGESEFVLGFSPEERSYRHPQQRKHGVEMNPPANRLTPPPSVTAQIARLPQLPMAEIKALWRKLFDTENPTHNRQFLERRIAYKLQENAFRTVDPELLERNARRIQALIDTGKAPKRDRELRLVPGTVLTREYRGIEHHVAVMQDGQYQYQGRSYPSLSIIAREITGTRWSGPLFFGLKRPVKAKPKTARGGRP